MKRNGGVSVTVVVVLSIVFAVTLLGGAYVAAALYRGTLHIFASDRVAASKTEELGDSKKFTIDDAIKYSKTAREYVSGLKDYECTYVRAELIKDKLVTSRVMLRVRHDPFSVNMKWIEPETKKDREVGWIAPDKQMCIKGVPLVKKLDIEGALAKSESLRPVSQAGIKNMVDRLHASWEREQKLDKTTVEFQDGPVKFTLSDQEYTVECHCITTLKGEELREPAEGEKFKFHRTRCYFDKKTGALVCMEGYGWPKEGDTEGELLERHTFLNLKTNVGLEDSKFKW